MFPVLAGVHMHSISTPKFLHSTLTIWPALPSHFASAVPDMLCITFWVWLWCLQWIRAITEVQWAKKKVTCLHRALKCYLQRKKQLWTASKTTGIKITSACSWDGFYSSLSKSASSECFSAHSVAFSMRIENGAPLNPWPMPQKVISKHSVMSACETMVCSHKLSMKAVQTWWYYETLFETQIHKTGRHDTIVRFQHIFDNVIT